MHSIRTSISIRSWIQIQIYDRRCFVLIPCIEENRVALFIFSKPEFARSLLAHN